MTNLCPCGSNKNFEHCCQVFILGQRWASTPEELMRSRYTAYTLCDIEYIAKTMQGNALEDFDIEGTRKWAKRIKWLKLNVMDTSIHEDKGFVEFTAHYSDNYKIFSLHEKSEFHLRDSKWYYVDGVIPERKNITETLPKVSLNALCPCGSNKKYKKCCGQRK